MTTVFLPPSLPYSRHLSVNVTSNTSWTAESSASWLNITSGTPGNLNGQVKFDISENNSTVKREATITVKTGDPSVKAELNGIKNNTVRRFVYLECFT